MSWLEGVLLVGLGVIIGAASLLAVCAVWFYILEREG